MKQGYASLVNTLLSDMQWMAQAVHQEYHQDIGGTWQDCPRIICSGAAMSSLGVERRRENYDERHPSLDGEWKWSERLDRSQDFGFGYLVASAYPNGRWVVHDPLTGRMLDSGTSGDIDEAKVAAQLRVAALGVQYKAGKDSMAHHISDAARREVNENDSKTRR